MVVYATLAIFAAFAAFPLVLIVSTALKQPADARRDPFGLFTTTTLQNFADAWIQGKFGHFFLNTVWITGATVLGVVLLSVARRLRPRAPGLPRADGRVLRRSSSAS